MGLVSLTAVTCAFFLLTSIGQMHQKSQLSSNNDDFAEFDDEEFDGVSSQTHERNEPSERADNSRSMGQDLGSGGGDSTEDEDPGVDDVEEVEDIEKIGKNGAVDKDFKSFDDEPEDEDDVLIEEETEQPAGEKKKPMGDLFTGVKKEGLKVIDVPEHLRTKWDGFYLEFLLLIGLVSYALNFFYGKQKNQKLASAWLDTTRTTLERNFAVVGDDGTSKEPPSVTSTGYSPVLMKETEHVFSLWCSGRVGCQSLLIDLKFVKRQDIISLISRIMKPASDLMEVNVTLDEEFEPLIFAFGTKKVLTKNLKELQDLSSFCDGRKSCERFKLPQYFYAAELGEAADFVVDSELQKFLKTYPDLLDYLHISDQYSGKKPDDQTAGSGPPSPPSAVAKVLQARFAMPKFGRTQPEDMDVMLPCLKLMIYFIDKLKKLKLSKEARSKAERNRCKMEEAISKMLHSQRQESQQLRKEEKVRMEKERLMNETDPDKLRKLEDAQAKRDRKKNQPKMKSMMVRMK
ncbi:PAT complex subunit CCDC47-like [Convolutriloba macropyga]|uniref:PAT complex subunit CCDC47-like n=1 Tax=Convolutriloba macropyga TaxID=536237 RepID=UPI003F525C7A